MPRVGHFDVSADDPQRALRFYETVFGWKIEKWDGPFDYWRIKTGSSDQPGIDGGLAKREEPWQGVTPVIDVPSVDAFAEKIEAEGGTIMHPRVTIPNVGYLVSFKDTEGNVFAILEADDNAN